MHLIDRLTRAGIAELGWPVGGADDQRHTSVGRLDNRRVEVRGRRPRGTEHHHRSPAREREPERTERGRPLVEHDLHL
jgi:hypothetical protein